MATYSGRNASVKLATNLVQELGEWTLSINLDEIDTTVFGSTWGKSDVGFKKWSCTFSGFYDPSDSTGQGALKTALLAGSLITNLRLYVDSTSYWTPDLTSDSSAGARITSMEIRHDKAGVASLNISMTGSGPATIV